MTQAELVPVVPGIIGKISQLTVDARALHTALQVRRDFSTWIKGRISKYEFVEGEDFEKNSMISRSPNSGNGDFKGFQQSIDYRLSLDMGKELCMVENNEKGRIARRYFIECERRLLSAQSSLDGQLPASLQSELHALVDAKLSAFPRAVQGRARSEIWARFNRHFKIARYAQLPAERMPEARDYLIEMEVRALASLPASAPLPAPKQDIVPAWDEMPMPADMDKRRARICRELYELQEKFGCLVDDIRICLNPGGRLLRLPPELDNAYETLAALNRVATGGAYTPPQAILSPYHIGKGLKFV